MKDVKKKTKAIPKKNCLISKRHGAVCLKNSAINNVSRKSNQGGQKNLAVFRQKPAISTIIDLEKNQESVPDTMNNKDSDCEKENGLAVVKKKKDSEHYLLDHPEEEEIILTPMLNVRKKYAFGKHGYGIALRFSAKDKNKFTVRSVRKHSPADVVQIRVNDEVKTVGKDFTPITDAKSFNRLAKNWKTDEIRFTIIRKTFSQRPSIAIRSRMMFNVQNVSKASKMPNTEQSSKKNDEFTAANEFIAFHPSMEYNELLPEFNYTSELIYCYNTNVDHDGLSEDDLDVCSCSLNDVNCRDMRCVNKATKIQCSPNICHLEGCGNKYFDSAKASVELTVKNFGIKGFGDCFVIEYVGEVIGDAEHKKRLGDGGRYILEIKSNSMFIDSQFYGNESRFINHSCDPNCEFQIWLVSGQLRAGVFSLRDIEKDEELTVEYNPDKVIEIGFPCHCDSIFCRKFIG